MIHAHFRFVLGCVVTAFIAGCSTPMTSDPTRDGPFFRPINYTSEASVGSVRRVVLLPLFAGEVAPVESAQALDAVIASALQSQQRFEVVTLSREDCRQWFRVTELSSTSVLPHDFLAVLRRQFAADAVLFVDLTVFRAYRPVTVGFRAKLATLDAARLVWSFDTIYSAMDASVANAARRHFAQPRRGAATDLTVGVLHSPTQFAAYAATSMFSTLPPVFPPVVAPTAAPEAPQDKVAR